MWRWFVFQGFVFWLVIMSNVHWHWTPNGYLAAGVGVGVSFVATWIVTRILLLPAAIARLRGAILRNHPKGDNLSLPASGRQTGNLPQ